MSIVPILKPAGWAENHPLIFRQPLAEHPKSPVIVYGKLEGEDVRIQEAQSEEELQVLLPKYREEALATLRDITLEIVVEDVEGFKVAFLQNHALTAEAIIDSERMKQIQEQLEARSIVVAIPMQGFLMAVDYEQQDQVERLAHIASQMYQSGESEPITTSLFMVMDGQITAIAVMDDPKEMVQGEDDGSFLQIGQHKENGNVLVAIGFDSFERFAQTVLQTYQGILNHVAQTGFFGGTIDYHIHPGIMPKTDELIQVCKALCEEDFRPSGLVGVDHPLKAKVRFLYEEEVIAQTAEPGKTAGGLYIA